MRRAWTSSLCLSGCRCEEPTSHDNLQVVILARGDHCKSWEHIGEQIVYHLIPTRADHDGFWTDCVSRWRWSLQGRAMWRSHYGSSRLNAIACKDFRHIKEDGQSRQRYEGWDIGQLLDRNRIAEESELDI